MKTIEHRRHSMRVKPGQHLSQAGVDLARAVGEGMGSFDLVVTSTLPRAFETAIAMGHAVGEQRDELVSLPEDLEEEIGWDDGFSRWASAVVRNPKGIAARFARKMADLHREIASRIPQDGSALVISHGGIVEASAIGCKPDADYAEWAGACGYCEGVRLTFDGSFCTAVEWLGIPAAHS